MVSRISASSYSNTAPLVWSFLYGSRRGSVEMILDTAPARSAQVLAEGRVASALVPVIGYQTIPGVRLVPDVCVGAREQVRSVCLVTRGMELEDVGSVALDVSSKTSVALTKIIFREFLGSEPVFKPAEPNIDRMLGESDCALLIGDPALALSICDFQFAVGSDQSQIRVFDLVELWRRYTGFGFVFAMWMSALEAVPIDFAGARDEGLRHVDEIISNYESEIRLPRDDFRRYLTSNISYSIDESMRNGLELYFRLAMKNGLIERNRQLEFVK